MESDESLLYGRGRRRDRDDGHYDDVDDNGDLLADFGQLEDEIELPEFRGSSRSKRGGSPSNAVAGVDLSSFYTSHEGDDEEKDGTVRLEGHASWQSVVPSTPSHKLQFEHQVVSERLAQTADSPSLPQKLSKTHSNSPCQTLCWQRIVHDAPAEDSRALYNSSLRWHGTEVSEEDAEMAIKMSPNVVLHPDQLHDHETRLALLRRKIRKEALYAFRMSDSSKTGLLDRDDFDNFMATMGYTAPVQQLVSKSDLLLSEKSFCLASQLSKIHVKSTEPLLSEKLKHASIPKGFASLDAFADIKQASTQSACSARGSDGGSTHSKSVSPNYIHVDADFAMTVLASGVTLEGAVGFAQVIFGLDEFDSHELRLVSCEIRKRQLMHKRRKVVPAVDGKEDRSDKTRSFTSPRTELLKSSSQHSPVNQERRHMFRKERYEELKSELEKDFEAKHTFKPTIRALEVIHIGSRVDALIHRNLGGDVIDGRGEWISALVRSSFSDDTYEVELVDAQPPASLMRLPKERIRASSSSSSAASSVSSLDDLTRRIARERSSSVRRQDFRKTEERELEEVCTFQPSVKPAPSKVADAAASNKPASRRRRQVPPPPSPLHGSTAGTTNSIVGFTSGGGGGLFVPGQGFLPGAPTSVGMALFYYNSAAPPSFSSGTYKVIQYTSVAEGMSMVYSSPAPSSSSSLSSSSSSSSSTSARALTASNPTSMPDRPYANNFSMPNAAGPQAPGGDGIPIAPVLPPWVWTTATSSSGAADILQTPGKPVSTPSKVVIKKKIPGEAKDEKASGSGWQNVLEELARKVGGGKGNDSLLKKVEVRQVGKLSTGKKGRRGAKDFSDVIDELSYTLAKMRGEIQDEPDDDGKDGDGNGDDEPGTLANGSPSSVGKSVLGKISSVLKPPPPPPPPQKPTGPALKLARPKALMIPQPPLLDESKFPYKQKLDAGGVGTLSTSASTTPLAKLFPSLPSVVLKEAVPTPSVKPAPPPLPSTWPPQAYVERAAAGGEGARGVVDLVGGGAGDYAVRGSGRGLHDDEREHRGGGGGGGGGDAGGAPRVAVMAELPIVGPMCGGFNATATAAQNVTFHDNPLPAGYYAAAPDSIAVSPGSIVPAGTILSEHLSSCLGTPLVASPAAPSEDSSVNNTADGNSEASSAGPRSPHLPLDYFAAIQRMRRAHEVRRAREETKHFGDARYFDETKLHERPQRTQPEEFHFSAAARAEQKKVFTHRQKTPERERPTEDWAHSGAKFAQSLRDYSPSSRTPRADSPSRSKSAPHGTQRSHSRGSIIFAGLARDFPSPSKRSGGVSLHIMNPSVTQPVEPKLHSPFVALKNREIRLRRQQDRDLQSAQVAKQLKEKKEAARLLSMSTYSSPLTPRRHAHERILQKNPDLMRSLAKLCL